MKYMEGMLSVLEALVSDPNWTKIGWTGVLRLQFGQGDEVANGLAWL